MSTEFIHDVNILAIELQESISHANRRLADANTTLDDLAEQHSFVNSMIVDLNFSEL